MGTFQGEMTAEDKDPVEKNCSEKAEAEMSPPAYDEGNPLTSDEPAVKITANETKIDIGKDGKEQYKSLSKEELMKFANDPYWVRLRWILFALFWIIWVAMLVASIVIIINAPKCPSPEPKKWWQKNAMYKVNVRDGEFTDIKAIQKELDYLVGSGVGTVYITSLTKPTPSQNDGVLDYKTINPDYGTFEDWKVLVEDFQARDQKVVIDFIPNHTADADIKLEDWTVIQDLQNVMKYWIETGVNGFVINDVSHMVTDGSNLPELIERLRTVVDHETDESGVPCVLIAEDVSDPTKAEKYYGSEISESNLGSLFHLALFSNQVDNPAGAEDLKTSIDKYTGDLPVNAWPSYAFSSTTKPEMIDAMTMVKMLMPGTPMFVAGEELGLDSWDSAKAAEQSEATGSSHLKVFSTLAAKLRPQDSVLFGEMEGSTFVMDQNVFGLTRVKKGNPGYLLLANFGDEEMELDISGIQYIPSSIRLMVKSVSDEAADDVRSFETDKVLIKPKEGRVFTFVPEYF